MVANNTQQQQPLRRNVQRNSNGLTLKSIVAFAVAKWYWFVISLVVTMSAATLYLMKTTPQYTRTASLLIKNSDKKSNNAGTSIDMSELGLIQTKTNLENEIRIVKSPTLMEEVVSRLDLNDRYTIRDGLREALLYKETPVLFLDTLSATELYPIQRQPSMVYFIFCMSIFVGTRNTAGRQNVPFTSVST